MLAAFLAAIVAAAGGWTEAVDHAYYAIEAQPPAARVTAVVCRHHGLRACLPLVIRDPSLLTDCDAQGVSQYALARRLERVADRGPVAFTTENGGYPWRCQPTTLNEETP